MASELFGHPQSTCTQRVLLLCDELDIPYDMRTIQMQQGEHLAADYVQDHHPFGQIPAWLDQEVRVFESRAICAYLFAKFGSQGHANIIGDSDANPSALARIRQAASVEYSYFDPSMKVLAYEKVFKSMMGNGPPDQKVVDANLSTLRTTLDYYDRLLESQRYLAGDNFSLIDLYAMPWFGKFEMVGLTAELVQRKRLAAWWQQVTSRSSWKNVQKLL